MYKTYDLTSKESFEEYLRALKLDKDIVHSFVTGSWGMLTFYNNYGQSSYYENGCKIHKPINDSTFGKEGNHTYIKVKLYGYVIKVIHDKELDQLNSKEDLDPVTGFPRKSMELK